MWTFHEEFAWEARPEAFAARRESGWFMAGLAVLAIATATISAVRAGAQETSERPAVSKLIAIQQNPIRPLAASAVIAKNSALH